MALKLKPLNEQVIVITGASSGIGLCTAESAAKQGAKVVLAARSARTSAGVSIGTTTGVAAAGGVCGGGRVVRASRVEGAGALQRATQRNGNRRFPHTL